MLWLMPTPEAPAPPSGVVDDGDPAWQGFWYVKPGPKPKLPVKQPEPEPVLLRAKSAGAACAASTAAGRGSLSLPLFAQWDPEARRSASASALIEMQGTAK